MKLTPRRLLLHATLLHILALVSTLGRKSGRAKCGPKSSGVIPHPLFCNKFLQCRFGKPWMTRPCPAGTLFNTDTLRCDHAYLVTCNRRGFAFGITMNTNNLLEHEENYGHSKTKEFGFDITKQWDSKSTGHDPIRVTLIPGDGHVIIRVSGPFFNDPPNPGGKPGEPFPELYNYEVVEAFFLADDDKYLEVELCPHGQHLVLLLNGRRNAIKDMLPLKFSAAISGHTWSGEAEIPADYFPPDVTRFNAYAIHGSDEKRMYEALYPAPEGKHDNPDFHRLEYFQPIDFPKLLPSNKDGELSDIWKDNMK